MASQRFIGMRIPVHSPEDLGLALRAARKSQKVRLDDAAGSARVSPVLARQVEHGKGSVSIGKVMQLLRETGVTLSADIPDSAVKTYTALRDKGLRPLKPRKPRAGGGG